MKLRALDMDFVRPPREARRLVGWALLAVGTATCMALADHHAVVAQDHGAVLAQDTVVQSQLRSRRARSGADAQDAQLQGDIRRANGIIDQLTVPWEDLFDAVEASSGTGLGLLSMAPTARDRTLRLTGEARSMNELLAYVERLGQQPSLRGVHLQSYNTVARDGASVVSFALVATWKGQP